MQFLAASDAIVSFVSGADGKLMLDQPLTFSGEVGGISGPGDVIDLAGFDPTDTTARPGNYLNGTTILTIKDGSDHSVSLTLLGNYSDATFDSTTDSSGFVDIFQSPTNAPATATSVTSSATDGDASGILTFQEIDTSHSLSASVTPEANGYEGALSLDPVAVSDGSGSIDWRFTLENDQFGFSLGETITQSYDISLSDSQNPAMSQNQTISVSFGGPGDNNFIFHPGVGADTIINFDPQHDTIEFDHFADIQSLQQLTSEVVTDPHGDATINLGHADSVTFPGVTAAQFQAILQSSVHLH
jgi:hypothetical protein